MRVDPDFWLGRKVLVTGHTGFKGSWLSLWLAEMGAEVSGLSLDPPSTPSFFDVAGVAGDLADDARVDIRDAAATQDAVRRAAPDVILHLAAAPLVRRSYAEPVETFDTNVMGTAHVLEAARGIDGLKAIVCVTTDKCYTNKEWHWGYRETDSLGGRDPYAASKAAAEMAVEAWRMSFFTPAGGGPQVASARAGNVVGGGDWGADRLLPDMFRAFSRGDEMTVRSPDAVRPWQHILDCLGGYILLAQALSSEHGSRFARGWNFGPGPEHEATVVEIIERAARMWGDSARWRVDRPKDAPHEANLLKLDSSMARAELGWQARLTLEESLQLCVDWHKAHAGGEDIRALAIAQVRNYVSELTG